QPPVALVGRRGRRVVFFFQAEDGIRDLIVTGVQTCALPILSLKPLTPYEQALRAGIAADPFQQRLRAVYLAAASAIDSRMAAVEIGRASCRERVWSSVVALPGKKE